MERYNFLGYIITYEPMDDVVTIEPDLYTSLYAYLLTEYKGPLNSLPLKGDEIRNEVFTAIKTGEIQKYKING